MVTVQQRGDTLVLAGSIDEQADLAEIVGRAQNGRLVLDLSGIRFINSVGVREWVRMQQAATNQKLDLELRRVPEVIVHQLNIVVAARGSAIVTSFFAPYVCDECDREDSFLLDVIKHGASLAHNKAPEQTCESCGAQMALADPPEIYLMFISGS